MQIELKISVSFLTYLIDYFIRLVIIFLHDNYLIVSVNARITKLNDIRFVFVANIFTIQESIKFCKIFALATAPQS